jgi:hypothetical protein
MFFCIVLSGVVTLVPRLLCGVLTFDKDRDHNSDERNRLIIVSIRH